MIVHLLIRCTAAYCTLYSRPQEDALLFFVTVNVLCLGLHTLRLYRRESHDILRRENVEKG